MKFVLFFLLLMAETGCCDSWDQELISWPISEAKLVNFVSIHEKCTGFDITVNDRKELMDRILAEMKSACRAYKIPLNRMKREEKILGMEKETTAKGGGILTLATIDYSIFKVNFGGSNINETVLEELQNRTVSFEKKIIDDFKILTDDEVIDQWATFFEDLLLTGQTFRLRSLKFFPDSMFTRLGLNKTHNALDILNMVHKPIGCGEDRILVNVCLKVYDHEMSGRLYKILHTGSFVNDGSIFRFKQISQMLFVGTDGKMKFVPEDSCVQERNRYICDITKSKSATSLESFPDMFLPVAKHFTFVRHSGFRDIIASNSELYNLVDANGTERTLPFPRSGILIAGLPYDCVLKINGEVKSTGRLPTTELIHIPHQKSKDVLYRDLKQLAKNVHVQEELLHQLFKKVDSNWLDFLEDVGIWIIENWDKLLFGLLGIISVIVMLIACFYCYPVLSTCCECFQCFCKKRKSSRGKKSRNRRRRHSPSAPSPPAYDDEDYEEYAHNV